MRAERKNLEGNLEILTPIRHRLEYLLADLSCPVAGITDQDRGLATARVAQLGLRGYEPSYKSEELVVTIAAD